MNGVYMYLLKVTLNMFNSVQLLSCVHLCGPMDCSTLGFAIHQLPELTQTHDHWVGDAVQPSHPLLSPSPSAFSLFQYQGLFHSYGWSRAQTLFEQLPLLKQKGQRERNTLIQRWMSPEWTLPFWMWGQLEVKTKWSHSVVSDSLWPHRL